MAYLKPEHISELSSDHLISRTVMIQRGQSALAYVLHELKRNGLKGVVWRAKNDLGTDVALKFIPADEYSDHCLIDEMSQVAKLRSQCFAEVLFFGDLLYADLPSANKYKAVVTEWVDGEPLPEYVARTPLTVADFLVLAEQLFSALACLRQSGLCHDDLHPGNVLIYRQGDPLGGDSVLRVKIIDTGTVKRLATRDRLLRELEERVRALSERSADHVELQELRELLIWKTPDDHLRVVENLLHAANALNAGYGRLDFWERQFVDRLPAFFGQATDSDIGRRLDTPSLVVNSLREMERESRTRPEEARPLLSPFDYISAEMIRSDQEFANLFSKECPWLGDAQALQPLYLYGPRGCGKSTVLRWLSFKTAVADRRNLDALREVGVYVSCSVELRSRFWLLDDSAIDALQGPIVRFFVLLLLEELFDTLSLMRQLEHANVHQFGVAASDLTGLASWVVARVFPGGAPALPLRLEGQDHLSYIKGLMRKERWATWSVIQTGRPRANEMPDPAVVADVCRALPGFMPYFVPRHVTFLIDDYSNQRIPVALQRKLNQTISFAKQGTPIFKVSSEYNGVDLEGIQEGREVFEINIGAKYTHPSTAPDRDATFLADILDIRLRNSGYVATITEILGQKHSPETETMPRALADATHDRPFYYAGIETVHELCSGDVALALDLVRRIYEGNGVAKATRDMVAPVRQHRIISEFSHQEIRRIRYIVPFGSEMHDIVTFLGCLARAVLLNKRSRRKDRPDEPVCMTHLDIHVNAVQQLQRMNPKALEVHTILTSRAILFSLETSRSRLGGATERLQMRRIYFPTFMAAVKRDTPIKIDTAEDLQSLLTNPRVFAERHLQKAGVAAEQLDLALRESQLQPRE